MEISKTFNKARDNIDKALELLNKRLIIDAKTALQNAQKQLNEVAEFYKI